MQTKNLLVALAAFSAVAEGSVVHRRSPFTRSLAARQDENNGGGNAQLNGDVIQTGSQQDGSEGADAGQKPSATDQNNFINFCEGNDLTNGEQKLGGSCNGIPMGKIPAKERMVASVITNPQNGADLPSGQDFSIDVQMINFAPGTFTNPRSTYYSAPQNLDDNGLIIGHTHVTVQNTGDNLNPTQPLDPTVFAFFKGINDAGNGQNLLSANVVGGLPAGNYRLCTMAASANHQPVIMPVAQRGAQDDCVRFTVSDGGSGEVVGNDGTDNNGDQNQDPAVDPNAGNTDPAADPNQDQNQDPAVDPNAGNTDPAVDPNQNQDPAVDPNAGNTDPAVDPNQNQDPAVDPNQGNTDPAVDPNAGNTDQNQDQNNQTEENAVGDSEEGEAANPPPSEPAPTGGEGGSKAGAAVDGIGAPDITDSGDAGRPFAVNGNTFTDLLSAVSRACDIQRNACFDSINRAGGGARAQLCNNQFPICWKELS